jgi:hypothetical protein
MFRCSRARGDADFFLCARPVCNRCELRLTPHTVRLFMIFLILMLN